MCFNRGSSVLDMTMNIVFTSTGGDIDAVMIANETLAYFVDGKFDKGGIISGNVGYSWVLSATDLGTFDRTQVVELRNLVFPMSGIIGESNFDLLLTAVVVIKAFHGEFVDDSSRMNYYAGGFIVAPFDDSLVPANYAKWRDSFTALPVEPNTVTRRNQFLQTTNKEISTETGDRRFSFNLNTPPNLTMCPSISNVNFSELTILVSHWGYC